MDQNGRRSHIFVHVGMLTAVSLVVAHLLMGSAEATDAAPFVSAVALEGDTAPGTGGETFTSFDEPMVNTSADVAFIANFTGGGSTGVFLRHAGILSAIAVGGQSTSVGTLSDTFDGPTFNNLGTVAFVAREITGGSARTALFRKTLTGALTVIAARGDSAPGTGGGTFLGFDDLAQNDRNDVAFVAIYTFDESCAGPENGCARLSGVFLFKSVEGTIEAVVLSGDTLPGTGGTQCGTFREDIDGPWLNNNRTVAFIADSICGGPGGFEGSAFYKRLGGAIERLVLMGDRGPRGIGGTVSDIGIGRPGINDSDEVGLKLDLSGGSVSLALVRAHLGVNAARNSHVCAVKGGSAPGTVGTFSDFDPPAINGTGDLSVEVDLSGATGVTHGIYACRASHVEVIAVQGQPKPGTESTFGSNLSDASLSDRLFGNHFYVVFIDTASPTGVFIASPF